MPNFKKRDNSAQVETSGNSSVTINKKRNENSLNKCVALTIKNLIEGNNHFVFSQVKLYLNI